MDNNNQVAIDKRIFANYVKLLKEKDKTKKQKIAKDIYKDFDYLAMLDDRKCKEMRKDI